MAAGAASPRRRLEQTRPAGGHVAPLLLETEKVEQLVTEFWSNATPRNGFPVVKRAL
jgi:hypothetical protein